MRLTGGEALARQLVLEGVEQIFGVPGVQLDQAMDGLAQVADQVEYVVTRHEQGAAYMADGYARSTGEVGVCMVVPGPGMLNALAGLATAYACSSPVLCIAGQLNSAAIGRGRGVLHEVPDQSRLLDSVTKWHAMARIPEEVPALVRAAIDQLRSGRPRPVALEIPPDVLAAVADIDLIEPRARDELLAEPPPSALRRAVETLDQAERPVIYAGWGAQGADATEELRAVAELLQAPVVMSRSGLGSLPMSHPLAASKLAGRRLLPEADAVLVVGSRFRSFNGAPLVDDPAVPIVHIDADSDTLASRRATDVPLLADARLGLKALAKELASRERPVRDGAVADARQWATGQLAEIQPQQGYLDALRRAMPADGILVSELTQVAYLVRVGFPVEAPRANLTPGYQGTLGFGFPTALGAKRGNPERAVVSINGDGGFGWCLQELATAHQHGIGVVAVVFNDSGYGNVRRTQKDEFGERYIGTTLVNPDFVALARAFHVHGQRVSTPAELADAVAAAIASGKPALIEVPVAEMPDPWHLLG